ncbi:MAG: ribulokinase [Bacteroidetes bacterium]|jgi:L-ribulokinase|nr:ribulokinase [Bacteroidota bacterium]
MSSGKTKYVIGVDFGTDSVRSVLISTSGEYIGDAVHYYSRWKEGLYCDASSNQFRQHPLDYLEGLTETITRVLDEAGDEIRKNVVAISADTTGSTPVAVNKQGTPLALTDGFEENPNAMFILWKDHTSIEEAEEINELSAKWEIDYTKYVGGVYSSEWFWAKILHTLRADEKIRKHAYSWVEHCDWIPYELTGGDDITKMKRSRCAAGHKAMWHEEFDGLPAQDFLSALDPMLDGIRDHMFMDTYTADQPAGTLSKEWAKKLRLSEQVVVGVGAFDAHMGAVGGEIEPYYLSKVMGTSTCDMLIAPHEEIEGQLIRGICGQVDGSIVPGMMGLEAGQSAFGDVYAWFKDILLWPIRNSSIIDDKTRRKLLDELNDSLIQELEIAASDTRSIDEDKYLTALDWLNGRRTPDANQNLTSAIEGMNLGTTAPDMYRALVESTCFGAKAIVDRFIEEGIPIKGIIGMGGVAKKSPYVMQMMSNVLNMPIRIVKSDQAVALGAAMFAATAAGVFPKVEEAVEAMGAGFEKTYEPDPEMVNHYRKKYKSYCTLAQTVEEAIANKR